MRVLKPDGGELRRTTANEQASLLRRKPGFEARCGRSREPASLAGFSAPAQTLDVNTTSLTRPKRFSRQGQVGVRVLSTDCRCSRQHTSPRVCHTRAWRTRFSCGRHDRAYLVRTGYLLVASFGPREPRREAGPRTRENPRVWRRRTTCTTTSPRGS